MNVQGFVSAFWSLLNSQFSVDPPIPLAMPSSSDGEIQDDGLWIGRRKRGGRFVRYPEGKIRSVDRDFDKRVFRDPESVPMIHRQESIEVLTIPDVEPAGDSVRKIANAMLSARPSALVAVAHNANPSRRSQSRFDRSVFGRAIQSSISERAP